MTKNQQQAKSVLSSAAAHAIIDSAVANEADAIFGTDGTITYIRPRQRTHIVHIALPQFGRLVDTTQLFLPRLKRFLLELVRHPYFIDPPMPGRRLTDLDIEHLLLSRPFLMVPLPEEKEHSIALCKAIAVSHHKPQPNNKTIVCSFVDLNFLKCVVTEPSLTGMTARLPVRSFPLLVVCSRVWDFCVR
jgi:hypothetical protein